MKTEKMDKAVKIILGALLLVVGCVMLAAPVISVVVAIWIASIGLIAAGAAQIVLRLLATSGKSFFSTNTIIAIMNIIIGILILVFDKAIVLFLPVLVGIWLVIWGVLRILEGVEKKKLEMSGYQKNIGTGVVAIVGGVLIVVFQWMIAMNTIGVLLAVFSIIYGFVLLSDVLAGSGKPMTDEEISAKENADFYRFEEKLHQDDKKDS